MVRYLLTRCQGKKLKDKQGKIKELSLDDNEMYQVKTIVEFSK